MHQIRWIPWWCTSRQMVELQTKCRLKNNISRLAKARRYQISFHPFPSTLNGWGTRIVLVSYIALRPNTSPSNIDGPMLLYQITQSINSAEIRAFVMCYTYTTCLFWQRRGQHLCHNGKHGWCSRRQRNECRLLRLLSLQTESIHELDPHSLSLMPLFNFHFCYY